MSDAEMLAEYKAEMEAATQRAADDIWLSITKGPFSWPTWIFAPLPFGGLANTWRPETEVRQYRF